MFYTLARNRKFRMEQVSYEQLVECLGSDRYCEKITKYLTDWSRNAALFVVHPYCTTSQLEAVLDKLDFLDFFRGDIYQFVKVESMLFVLSYLFVSLLFLLCLFLFLLCAFVEVLFWLGHPILSKYKNVKQDTL